MAKEEWGIKRICVSCAAKFYDMSNSPIVCPSCGTEQDMEVIYGGSRRDVEEEAPKVIPVEKETKEGDDEFDLDVDIDLDEDAPAKAEVDDSTLLVEDDDLDDDALPGIEIPSDEKDEE